MARVLIRKPDTARPGEVVEISALIGHPMETGFRVDAAGRLVPRNLLRRFTCHAGETLLFAADLHPAVAANPYIAFALKAPAASTTLTLRWTGDAGFDQTETVVLTVSA